MTLSKFCQTGDPAFMGKYTSKQLREIQDILDHIKVSNLAEDKKRFYYMLSTYIKPRNITMYKDLGLTSTNICTKLAKEYVNSITKRLLFYTVYNNLVKKGIRIDLSNMTDSNLEVMYREIDSVYFNGELGRLLKRKNAVVIVRNTIGKDGIAGHCTMYKGCRFSIFMNVKIHSEPFKKYSKQKDNGITCYSPLECFIITFIHEMVHLIIYAFCYSMDSEGHGKVFKGIAFNLYGATHYRHSYGTPEDFGVTKEEIKNYKAIMFSSTSSKGKKIIRKGWIIDLGKDTVIVRTKENGIYTIYQTSYDSISKEEPDIGPAPKIGVKRKDILNRKKASFYYEGKLITGNITEFGRDKLTLKSGNSMYRVAYYDIIP